MGRSRWGIPIPTQLLAEAQNDAVTYFDIRASTLNGAKALDDVSESDLSALFPAILDHAFKWSYGSARRLPRLRA